MFQISLITACFLTLIFDELNVGGIFSYQFAANLSSSLTIKEFWKLVKIRQSYTAMRVWLLTFLEHSVMYFSRLF